MHYLQECIMDALLIRKILALTEFDLLKKQHYYTTSLLVTSLQTDIPMQVLPPKIYIHDASFTPKIT